MASQPRSCESGPLGNKVFARETSDPWLHSTSATHWSHKYEQLFPEAFHGSHAEVCLGNLQLFHEQLNGTIAYCGRAPCGSQVFLSVVPHSGEIYFRGRPIMSKGIATYAWDAVDRVTTSHRLNLLGLVIDQQDLDRYAQEVCGRPFVFGRKGPPLLFSQDPSIATLFQDQVTRMIDDARAFPELVDDERGRAILRQRVLDAMSQVLGAAWETARPLPSPSTRAYVVARSMEFMESHLADPIGITAVCRAVRVCPRTLRYSFETVLGVSPTRYLLATRLNRVHFELSRGTQEAIQSVAARWGFWHMGRFAQYYRAMFGERPSETSRLAIERRNRRISHPRLTGSTLPPERHMTLSLLPQPPAMLTEAVAAKRC